MSTPTEHWFARRFPIGDGRANMAPVHWKGWAVAFAFIVALLIAGGVFWWFTERDQLVKGAFVFAVLAAGAGLGLIRVANRRGDHIHCVADYEKGKLRV